MYNKVILWQEPLDVLQSLPDNGKCEMSPAQHGFLCGLLRKKRPRKILEVGVAAGGTSCVIMEALERLCAEDNTIAELHSVDLNTKYYRDTRQPVGYITERMGGGYTHVRRKTYYGNVLPKFIEEIGGDIDFLVLDTAHSLPGEVLDFLLALPYLKKDAAVVLHDVTLSLIVDSPGSFATNVLLEAVSGDKYLLFSDDYPEGVDNIGGFVITKETSENIANVFFSLLKRWSYMPNEEQLKSYKRFYEKYYDDECLRLFSAAVSFNRKAEYRGKLKDCYEDPGELEIVLRHWAAAKDRVVIYGIGKYGEAFVRYAKVANLKADALVVTDGQNLRTISGSDLPVYELSKLPYLPEECMVIIAVQSQCTRKIIEKELRFRGYSMVL